MCVMDMAQATDEKTASIRSRIFVLAFTLAILALAISGLMFVAFIATQRSSSQGIPSPDSPIVGTWKGEHGNVLNIRPDGTARSRSSTGTKFGYLEWNLEANELRVYHIVSTKSAAWKSRLHDWADGNNEPDARYDVLEISPTELKLLSTTGAAKGKIITFTTAADIELETAP